MLGSDCLEIGNNLTRINYVQSQSYFSWYAIANAPLIMSTPIDTMDEKILEILQESEVIVINQDFAGKKGQSVSSPLSRSGQVWAKPLSARNGSAAFISILSNNEKNVIVFLVDLGFYTSINASVRDVVARKDWAILLEASQQFSRGMRVSFLKSLPLCRM